MFDLGLSDEFLDCVHQYYFSSPLRVGRLVEITHEITTCPQMAVIMQLGQKILSWSRVKFLANNSQLQLVCSTSTNTGILVIVLRG